ncbi:hypothetical protein DM02DRAFT_662003 [Periconia macrospinosa]|uniref:Uncharacterized protein n=1 Tax=Periconia macrospinosa TaxID=97972 RepID=A0A2V1D814_9PLEO|nr:hypothetical protein DM02DRAFT_662003 [Periconia macrospinosa]
MPFFSHDPEIEKQKIMESPAPKFLHSISQMELAMDGDLWNEPYLMKIHQAILMIDRCIMLAEEVMKQVTWERRRPVVEMVLWRAYKTRDDNWRESRVPDGQQESQDMKEIRQWADKHFMTKMSQLESIVQRAEQHLDAKFSTDTRSFHGESLA